LHHITRTGCGRKHYHRLIAVGGDPERGRRTSGSR
jgi:hypothetical protein